MFKQILTPSGISVYVNKFYIIAVRTTSEKDQHFSFPLAKVAILTSCGLEYLDISGTIEEWTNWIQGK